MNRFISGFFIILFSISIGLASAHAFTITVEEKNDGFDGAVCTLRNAIETFNQQVSFGGCPFTSDGNPDIIMLLEGDYILSEEPTKAIPDNRNGDLDIEVSLSIVGQGPDITRVTGIGFPANNTDRIIEIQNECESGSCNPIEVTLQGFTVRDGNVDNVGGGILIGNYQNRLNLDQMRITNNVANNDPGGGIYINSQAFITDTTIDNNMAQEGGGLHLEFESETIMVNSTVNNNHAIYSEAQPEGSGNDVYGRGGGIFVRGQAIFTNSTISTNEAGESGGGIYFDSSRDFANQEAVSGAGEEFTAQLYNVTIADNTVLNDEYGFGGGMATFMIYQIPTDDFLVGVVDGAANLPTTVSVSNSLIARNQALDGPDCAGAYASLGFNLLGNPIDCMGFDQTGDQTPVSDAGLGPLQNNGGPTQTHGLQLGSPAIDMGNNQEGCQAIDVASVIVANGFTLSDLTEDQRHFPRPIAVLDPNSPICDIGAFEFQVFDFDVTKVDDVGGQTSVGSQFTYIITVTNSGPGVATNVMLNDPLPAQVTFNSVSSDQGSCSGSGNTVSCDLGTLNIGQTVTVQVVVTAVAEGNFTNIVTVTSEGGDTQQSVTKEASTSTQTTGGGGPVGGAFFFGSGCQLSALPVSGASSLAYLSLAVAGIFALRRRAK